MNTDDRLSAEYSFCRTPRTYALHAMPFGVFVCLLEEKSRLPIQHLIVRDLSPKQHHQEKQVAKDEYWA